MLDENSNLLSNFQLYENYINMTHITQRYKGRAYRFEICKIYLTAYLLDIFFYSQEFSTCFRILKPELIQNNQNFQARLYRVKGKRIPVLTEMPKLSWDFFNSSDVFIIHTPKNIFVWIGRAANAIKKLHATKVSV